MKIKGWIFKKEIACTYIRIIMIIIIEIKITNYKCWAKQEERFLFVDI